VYTPLHVIVKLCPCDITQWKRVEEWMYRSTFSWPPRPLWPQEKSSRYPLDRRLGGPQNRSGQRGEEKIFDPTGTRTPTPRLLYRLLEGTDTMCLHCLMEQSRSICFAVEPIQHIIINCRVNAKPRDAEFQNYNGQAEWSCDWQVVILH
jgi:hypothetical protein